ncbi:hypothetical protein B9J09_04855 [Xylella fastidiosa subsp. pauca]|nr:hypothetical protein B9J09_04855 [Xylella fastidiosa subsp. pauca]TNW23267.1 hypothetical protein EIP73_10650 [Xylella fastidiosa subsp. pauca]TNW25297.1 hypothetical protein EIP74_01925 [Xylella fastidiosa subsp. pauca]
MLAVINDWPAMCWLTMLRMRVIAVQAVFSCWNVVFAMGCRFQRYGLAGAAVCDQSKLSAAVSCGVNHEWGMSASEQS